MIVCHDCKVKTGKPHLNGCDIEECPICHKQLITCDHKEGRDFNPSDRLPFGLEMRFK